MPSRIRLLASMLRSAQTARTAERHLLCVAGMGCLLWAESQTLSEPHSSSEDMHEHQKGGGGSFNLLAAHSAESADVLTCDTHIRT
jgi:hypothetical protein